MSRRAGVLTVIFILGVFLTVAASAGANFMPFSGSRVLPNVYAGDINLEGMNREQGVLELLKLEDRLKEQTAIINYQNSSKELPLKSVDVDIDEQTVMDKALQVGHTGPIWERWNESLRTRNEYKHIPLAVSFNGDKLSQEANDLLAGLTCPPVDATFRITSDDKIEVIEGQSGLQVDHKSLYNELTSVVAAGKDPYRVEVSLVNIPPKHTVNDIGSMGLKGLLSSYTTKFDSTQIGRTYNVRVAAAALDGLLLAPGEEVKFNKVVGPRSTEAGYKNAKIILNNEFVDGLGGGVCQVSSTLYNAVLLADLAVTERHPHSLPVGYVPIGRDATVAYNHLDFGFQNNSDSYIYIKSSTGYNTLTFKIYGNTDNKKHVTINSWVTEVLQPKVVYEDDPNLAKGEKVVKQEGVKGYKATGELIITHNGNKTVKPLSKSVYRSQDEIIAVGTKETESTIELPEDTDTEETAEEDDAAPPTGEAPGDDNETDDNETNEQDEDTPVDTPADDTTGGTGETSSEEKPTEEVSGDNTSEDNGTEETIGDTLPEEIPAEDESEQENAGEELPEAEADQEPDQAPEQTN